MLNQVTVPVMGRSQCEAFYVDMIGPSMMCCGYEGGGMDSCSGDSGGPLVCQRKNKGPWFLYGITSWGIGCAEPKKPGVYTAVSTYRNWIQNITGGIGFGSLIVLIRHA